MSDRREPPPDEGWKDIHLDDIVRGVGSFISLVAEVVETVGSAVNQPTPSGRAYTPAGSASPTRIGGGALANGVRDPIVDLIDEGHEIVLVIDWPYGGDDQIKIEVQDDVLALSIGGEIPYTADMLLPAVVDPSSLRRSHCNGITEVRLTRAV